MDGSYNELDSWIEALNPKAKVGARHHTLPSFYLKRWAGKAGQLSVYKRTENKYIHQMVDDLAVKDFYTVIGAGGDLDARWEDILGRIETQASVIITQLLSAVNPLNALTEDQHRDLMLYIGFQVARGPRLRAEMQRTGDWIAKTQLQGRVPEDELRKLTITPHQNEHMQLMPDYVGEIYPALAGRPIALIHTRGAQLLTGTNQ